MTQSEEFPAEPIPAQPAPAAQPGEPAQLAQLAQPDVLAQPAQFGEPAQPSVEPAPMWAEPTIGTPTQAEYAFPSIGTPMPSPEEQAAAAAKKAKRRRVFAKSAILAIPAIVLVALLVGTGIEAGALSTKATAASTAAKTATSAGGLVPQLHAAQSAAAASILVDPGCVAVESQATATLEDKVTADGNNLATAENGTSFSAFVKSANTYTNDLQTFSTDLQQDAALTNRANLKSAIGAVTGDFGVAISAMQDALAGNLSASTENSLNATGTRIDGDATAVDTLCGGTTLASGSGSSSTSTPGNSTA